MTVSRVPRQADARDMAIVHQFYRREFALAPQIVRDLTPQQASRREAAEYWFDIVVLSMHHHHVAEDALLYPLLSGRAPEELLQVMEAQHEAVASTVDTVEQRLFTWRTDSSSASADALAEAFEDALAVLTPHLDEEERDIVPLISKYLTADDYAKMGTSGNDKYDDRTLMMAFGAMIEQCSAADADFMLSHLPPAVQKKWHATGAHDYAELMALLRQDLIPAEPEYDKWVMAGNAQTELGGTGAL